MTQASLVRPAEVERSGWQEQFDQNGYLVVDFELPERLIEDAIAFTTGHFFAEKDRGQKPILPHDERRVQDAWKFNAAVREIATFPTVLAFLRTLYGKHPLPFQTLNFPVGTELAVHSDVVHFNCWPNDGSMCGVWLALEDIDGDNGPLIYYPGTHKWPELFPINFNIPAPVDGEGYQAYERKLSAFVQ